MIATSIMVSSLENLKRQYRRASLNLRTMALKDFPAMNLSIIEHASRSLAVNLVFFCFQLYTEWIQELLLAGKTASLTPSRSAAWHKTHLTTRWISCFSAHQAEKNTEVISVIGCYRSLWSIWCQLRANKCA